MVVALPQPDETGPPNVDGEKKVAFPKENIAGRPAGATRTMGAGAGGGVGRGTGVWGFRQNGRSRAYFMVRCAAVKRRGGLGKNGHSIPAVSPGAFIRSFPLQPSVKRSGKTIES